MKTQELIEELRENRDAGEDAVLEAWEINEIIQKLTEYEELKQLAIESIDAQEDFFLFVMNTLSRDLEGEAIPSVEDLRNEQS